MNRRAKRAKTAVDPVVDVWHRELGELSTRSFVHRLAAYEDFVLRLELYKKLEKHSGCVNTISFSADGKILVSGSDDMRVILWDWEAGRVKTSFNSEHSNNVFQAKIMPFSDNRSIVTCAADGEVRHAIFLESGVETRLLGTHEGWAHRLAIEPGSPHIFYSCGEDGIVQHFDLRTGAATELFKCQGIDDRKSYMPVLRLNGITIDPRNPNLLAVAGGDEYARIYDIRKYKGDGSSDFGQPTDYFCPPHLIGDEHVGITGVAFSDQSELLTSYHNEFIYLFTRDMSLGVNPRPSSRENGRASTSATDADKQGVPQVYKGHRNYDTVKGVNFFGPKCEYVVSGSDCGRMFIWRKRDGVLVRVIEADSQVVNCIEPHPSMMVLASSGIDHDVKLWIPTGRERATLPQNIQETRPKRRYKFCISPRSLLRHLLALQRQDSDGEREGESSRHGRDLLDFFLTFDTSSRSDGDDDDGSNGGNEDNDGGDAVSREDVFS